jgi:hypothetical protein
MNGNRWKQQKFSIHTIAFLLMVISAVVLYPLARVEAVGWIWSFLAVFVVANLLVFLR